MPLRLPQRTSTYTDCRLPPLCRSRLSPLSLCGTYCPNKSAPLRTSRFWLALQTHNTHPTKKLTNTNNIKNSTTPTTQTNHLPTHRDITHLTPTTQTHNTHQNISPHSHNTTQSTTTLLATYHHPISPKKSLITQPAKLIDIQLYRKQQHTHHTNKLTPHLQTNHLPTHHNITHLTPATPNSQHKHQEHQLLIHKHTTKSTNTLSPTHHHTPQLKSQKSLITQPAKLTAATSQINHLPTHRDITHLTSTTSNL